MIDFRKLKAGDSVIYAWESFDGSGSYLATVSEVSPDHAIAEADGMHLWIDDTTADMFYPYIATVSR